MNRLDRLIAKFEAVAARPWSQSLAGAQRVWMVVYDPADERRLRLRLDEFAQAARSAGHLLQWCDLTTAFPDWMSTLDYKESYFEHPEDLLVDKGPLAQFRSYAAGLIREVLQQSDSESLVAVTGVGTLFGLLRVSELVESLHDEIPGRLVVLFPGTRSGNTYRLLDARDGWNYLALPIQA